jgi:hypothetical protein
MLSRYFGATHQPMRPKQAIDRRLLPLGRIRQFVAQDGSSAWVICYTLIREPAAADSGPLTRRKPFDDAHSRAVHVVMIRVDNGRSGVTTSIPASTHVQIASSVCASLLGNALGVRGLARFGEAVHGERGHLSAPSRWHPYRGTIDSSITAIGVLRVSHA